MGAGLRVCGWVDAKLNCFGWVGRVSGEVCGIDEVGIGQLFTHLFAHVLELTIVGSFEGRLPRHHGGQWLDVFGRRIRYDYFELPCRGK